MTTKKPRAPRKSTKPVEQVSAELGNFEQNVSEPQVGADFLRIEYVPVKTLALWDKNAKIHDADGIIGSIKEHGFKDPPKWEPKLNGGAGGIVAGNGRVHFLREMEIAQEEPPRGIKVDGEGAWYMPVLFGVDSESENAAAAYGIDHNNIGLLGGDFRYFDIAKLYEPKGYTELLAELSNQDALPISVDSGDVDRLIARMVRENQASNTTSSSSSTPSSASSSFEQTQHIVKSDSGAVPQFSVAVICEDEGEQQAVYEALKEKYDDVRRVTS